MTRLGSREDSPQLTVAHGLTVFSSLPEALRAGFHTYERTSFGYRVRIRTSQGYAFALVDMREKGI